jgi:hypothetical protein
VPDTPDFAVVNCEPTVRFVILLLSAPEGLFRFYQLFVDKSIIAEK